MDQVRRRVEERGEWICAQRFATAEVWIPEGQPVPLCEGTLDQERGRPVAH